MSRLPETYPAIRLRVADTSLDECGRALRQGPERSLRQVQRLIEQELKRLPADERGPLACRAGCDFCCHLRVMATAVEVFALLDYQSRQLDAEAFDAFAERIRAADRALRELPMDRVLTTNLPCPALIDGQCSGYPARPLNCRSYHSISREDCQASFEHPEDLELGHPQLRGIASVHEGAQGGFLRAFEQAGQDARQYELVTALAEALDDPECRQRLARGEPVFQRPSILADSD
ncbi:YkgJ family cysteine cluster protein [Wenzhouxiangella marina]|uniref:Uncharacterized protein n=1 Tax=Wenzhouxiangella marina TaxID=1579979 RepID=A0A0K0XYG5_9GAMM|nr:YkgJ family cysteine cluster protein [Wenzhouxiangella marina]AKS42682.1 hypothetical protein WM2015_2319 [Wenzhouxiangella marina]MBB6088629.1 Fe-S-cluster containining protein [Wenzhouxiangella marina]